MDRIIRTKDNKTNDYIVNTIKDEIKLSELSNDDRIKVETFVDEMLIKDETSTLNLDTIYSLYRRWCQCNYIAHIDHYNFKRNLTREITFHGIVQNVKGLKINQLKVKELKVKERKTR